MDKAKLRLIMAAIFTGLIFLAVGALTAADVPDVISIENKGYKSDKKGPVKLTHKKHSVDYKVKCDECHHVFKDGKNVWKEGDPVQKCSACHDPEEKKAGADKLQTAFHKNCQTCHKQLKDKEAPYKKCNDCHQSK
jgi:hypothetical protein